MKLNERNAQTDDEFDLEKIKSLRKFDVANYLDSPELIEAFLSEAFTEGDSSMIAEGLNAAARATGMTEVAEKAGLARESLYKAFRPGSQPRLDTILRVLKALGFQLSVQAIPKQSDVATPEIREGGIDPVG